MPRKQTELPPAGTGRYERDPHPDHVAMIKRLNTKPGEWFEVAEKNTVSAANQLATRIRHATALAFRDGTYEATVRGKSVWARVVP